MADTISREVKIYDAKEVEIIKQLPEEEVKTESSLEKALNKLRAEKLSKFNSLKDLEKPVAICCLSEKDFKIVDAFRIPYESMLLSMINSIKDHFELDLDSLRNEHSNCQFVYNEYLKKMIKNCQYTEEGVIFEGEEFKINITEENIQKLKSLGDIDKIESYCHEVIRRISIERFKDQVKEESKKMSDMYRGKLKELFEKYLSKIN